MLITQDIENNLKIVEQKFFNVLFEKEIHRCYAESIEEHGLLEGIDEIVFLFSGGKDATFGLTLLLNYLKESQLKIGLGVLLITYPKHVYFGENGIRHDVYTRCLKYWDSQNMDIKVVEPAKEDLTMTDSSGCSVCKKVRMAEVQRQIGSMNLQKCNIAIATGYTLYDAHAYLQEFALISNYTYDVNKIEDPSLKRKMLNCLHKIKMKETLPNGIRMIRPLLKFKENTIRDYLNYKDIPFVNVPCKVADYKPKRMIFKTLNEMTNELKITYDGLLSFLDKHSVNFPEDFDDIAAGTNFTDC